MATADTRAGSTPLLPSTIVNDHAPDEDLSSFLPLCVVQDRAIFDPWIGAKNYFFEVCVWVGLATYSSAYPYGYLAWLAPAVILGSILWVTGIPATEAQAVRSKGDAYRAYQMRVSRFVPLPPKRS